MSNEAEHPEQRLHEHGPSVLSTAELLSVIFSSNRRGARYCSVEDARAFLEGLNSLSELLHETSELYCEHFGPRLGRQRFASLQAGIELSKRFIRQNLNERDVLSSPEDVRQYLAMHHQGLQHEILGAVFLDN